MLTDLSYVVRREDNLTWLLPASMAREDDTCPVSALLLNGSDWSKI